MTYLPASSPPVRSRTSAITDRPCLVSTWDTQVNALVVLASAAFALWAGDEVLRGVNPFRRLLGLAMLAWLGLSLVRLWLTT
jgi:hypothetical protein